MLYGYTFNDPHPKRCDSCAKHCLEGDKSCPVYIHGPRPFEGEKEVLELCGMANVITRYIGCMYWKKRTGTTSLNIYSAQSAGEP